MIRTAFDFRFRSLVALACLTPLVVSPLSGAMAAETDGGSAAQAPVKRIVLFTSGVGYFEHRGAVTGNATIDLKFDVDDVNDLLKSMVLEDLGGGKISTVTYASRDPITKTLETFAIDVTKIPSLGQLLMQIRGQRVEIDAPIKAAGTIVSVERQRQSSKDLGVIETELLTLLTDDGLRRIPLDSIGRIRLVDEALDGEFRKALEVLATGHASDQKSVTLEFLGEGERNVRIGYIQEAPVWKTSYRLVLDDEERPFLQGWAIVENTTDSDWQEVQLSLVSGRPISFVMDLYSPLYADRPLVTPELYSSLRPQVYDQDLQRSAEMAAQDQLSEAAASPAPPAAAPESPSARPSDGAARTRAGRRVAMGGGFGGAAGVPSAGESIAFDVESYVQLGESVVAAAQGAAVGELFNYEIDNPVTIARQTSAMLPIINNSIAGEKVSIYNANVQAKHPLNGFRLKNSSDLHLMQGPVTVFDGGVYAGDARLPDLSPGAERLVSYAMDLDVEVASTSDSTPQDLVSVKIDKGVLAAAYKQRRTQSYTLKNSGDAAQTVIVEHPVQHGWGLVEPKEPTEKTRDFYRFAVEAKPGEPAELKIVEEQTIQQTVAVASVDNNGVQAYLSSQEVSDEVKGLLREVVRRRDELASLDRVKQQRELQIKSITEEQDRLRQNMQAIDRDTDLYTRYVGKLTAQEDQIEKLREELQIVVGELADRQKSLDEYLGNLTLQ